MSTDDVGFLACSTIIGLSMLLSVCSDYGQERNSKHSSTKSNFIIFCCKIFKDPKV